VPPLQVLIVESHEVVASALARSLASEASFTTRCVNPEREDVAAVCEATGADLAVVGLLLNHSGRALELIRPLTDRSCRTVVMTTSAGASLAGRCLREGAAAVVDKDMAFEHLVEVLLRLGAGEDVISEEERAALLEHLVTTPDDVASAAPFNALTPRQACVLAALIDGVTPQEFGRRHHLSINTVRTHIRGILGRLGVGSQREALVLARQMGWPPRDARASDP
jgi:DNA-binding NarL/FixJ family response regulator